MRPLSSTITINAAADHVWDIVAHRFGRIGEWATAIPASTTIASSPADGARVRVESPVAGRVCDTGIRAVPRVTETIVAYDEDAKTLTYQATAGMPSFVTLARNTWQVTPLGDQRTQVSYAGELQVRGLLGVLVKCLLLARVARDGRYLLHDLKHYAEHGDPSPRKRRGAVAGVSARPADRMLRAALRTNAVFSLASGLTLAAGAWWYPALLLVGAPVTGFGLLVAMIAAGPADGLRRRAIVVVIADLLWVAASAVLLALDRLPAATAVAVGAVAVIVAVLAGWQTAGLTGLRRDERLPVRDR